MYRLDSRLSKEDADRLADVIEQEFALRAAGPVVKKLRRLGELGAAEESDLFSLDDIHTIATVLRKYPFVEQYPERYDAFQTEIVRIATTGR